MYPICSSYSVPHERKVDNCSPEHFGYSKNKVKIWEIITIPPTNSETPSGRSGQPSKPRKGRKRILPAKVPPLY